MDKLLWYIYYIAIKFFWKALFKCFINLSIAVHDNSSRNFWTLSEFPFCPLYHYTSNTQHQEETWLIVILFMKIIFPLPMCFECIWPIPFLNQQPTDKSKMKQQNLPSIICFLDSPLSVSALTRKRSKWLSGMCFLLSLFEKYRRMVVLDGIANFIPYSWKILHHCRLRRKAGG